MFRILEFLNKHRSQCITIIFVIWGIYLRFCGLARRELWNDETYAFPWLSGPLKPFWQRLSYGAELTSFPGHYLTTWPFIQIFGLNKWGIMIPHIIATFIGFYLLYLICRRYLRSSVSYAVVFGLACFNPELIFHSFEFRPYSVLATLSLAVFYFSDTLICQKHQLGRGRKFWIGVLFIFTVFYHAYGAMILFFITVFFAMKEMAVRSFKEILADSWRFYILVSLIALPVFLWYAMGSSVVATKLSLGIDTFQFIPNPLVNLVGFLKGVFCNLTGDRRLYFLCAGIIFSFLIPHKNRMIHIGFLLILVLIPIQIILLSDLNQNYWFLQRQFIWIMPLFIFFLGWCWDSVIIQIRDFFKHRSNRVLR